MSSVATGVRVPAWLVAGRWLDLAPVAVALATISAIAVREPRDPDLWWHLATGRYIVAERRVPAFDVFSHTAVGHRWVTHEWLSDLLLYGGYRLLGMSGLVLLFAALIVATYVLVYRRCQARGIAASASVMLAAAASAMTWGVRPQMFSLFFASLYLYILEDGGGRKLARLWALPLLSLLWANLHSSFVVGLVLVAAFALAEEWNWLWAWKGSGPWLSARARRLMLVWVGCLALSLVTPNGISAALFPFGTLSNGFIQSHIEEWFSPDFHAPWAWPLAAFWLALLGACALSPRRASARDVLLLLGAGAAGLYSARHVPFLGLVGAPLLAQQLTGPELGAGPGVHTRRPVKPVLGVAVGLAALALAVTIGIRVFRVMRASATVDTTRYPVTAVAFIEREQLDRPLYNTYHWGGYLIWRGHKVFVDGRAELYGDEVLGEYLKAYRVAPDWEKPLLDHDVGVVLIETDSSLAVVLRASGRWRQVYRDELATVFVPATSGQQAEKVAWRK